MAGHPYACRPMTKPLSRSTLCGLVAKSFVVDEKPGGGEEGRAGGLTKGLGAQPDRQVEDARRETADLEWLRHWVNTHKTGCQDVEIARLAAWMPRVARFSCRIEVCRVQAWHTDPDRGIAKSQVRMPTCLHERAETSARGWEQVSLDSIATDTR
jgi:hypothetical protein